MKCCKSKLWIFAFAIMLSLSLVAKSQAFPVAPVPLHSLWKRAELIVFADVVSCKTADGRQIAGLLIASVLKGAEQPAGTLISFGTLLGGCPYPHYFEANERVLAFLSFDHDEMMYTPVGNAEAVIATTASGFRVFEGMLNELPAIYEQRDATKRNNLLLRWNIRCLLDPTTRIAGFWSLPSVTPKGGKTMDWLLPDEAERLIEAALNAPLPDDAIEILTILQDYPSDRLDEYFLLSLKKCDEPDWRGVARFALKRLPDRLRISLIDEVNLRTVAYQKRESDYLYGRGELKRREKKSMKESLDTEFGWLCGQVWRECLDAR